MYIMCPASLVHAAPSLPGQAQWSRLYQGERGVARSHALLDEEVQPGIHGHGHRQVRQRVRHRHPREVVAAHARLRMLPVPDLEQIA